MAYLKYSAWYIALSFLDTPLGDIADTTYFKANTVLANNHIYEGFMMISNIIGEIWANFEFAYMYGGSLIA